MMTEKYFYNTENVEISLNYSDIAEQICDQAFNCRKNQHIQYI